VALPEAQLQPEDTDDDSCAEDFPHHHHLDASADPEPAPPLPLSHSPKPVEVEKDRPSEGVSVEASSVTEHAAEKPTLDSQAAPAPTAPVAETPPTLKKALDESEVDTDTEIEQLTKSKSVETMTNYQVFLIRRSSGMGLYAGSHTCSYIELRVCLKHRYGSATRAVADDVRGTCRGLGNCAERQ